MLSLALKTLRELALFFGVVFVLMARTVGPRGVTSGFELDSLVPMEQSPADAPATRPPLRLGPAAHKWFSLASSGASKWGQKDDSPTSALPQGWGLREGAWGRRCRDLPPAPAALRPLPTPTVRRGLGTQPGVVSHLLPLQLQLLQLRVCAERLLVPAPCGVPTASSMAEWSLRSWKWLRPAGLLGSTRSRSGTAVLAAPSSLQTWCPWSSLYSWPPSWDPDPFGAACTFWTCTREGGSSVGSKSVPTFHCMKKGSVTGNRRNGVSGMLSREGNV